MYGSESQSNNLQCIILDFQCFNTLYLSSELHRMPSSVSTCCLHFLNFHFLGVVDLDNCSEIAAFDQTLQDIKMEYVLSLKTMNRNKHRVYFMSCENEETMNEWVSNLIFACNLVARNGECIFIFCQLHKRRGSGSTETSFLSVLLTKRLRLQFLINSLFLASSIDIYFHLTIFDHQSSRP